MTIQIPTLDFLAILPQLILVGMALLILLAEVTLLRHAKSGLGWLALLGMALALGASAWLWQGPPRRFRWRGRTHEVLRAEGPERIAPEWWRERSSVRLRDYYRVEDGAGRRYWIYRAGLAGDGRGGMPEWFLQGLYA